MTGPWAAFAGAAESEARSLFRTGEPMTAANEARFLTWCERWTRRTGRRPNFLAYVLQRHRGLVWPARRAINLPGLAVRGVGEPRS